MTRPLAPSCPHDRLAGLRRLHHDFSTLILNGPWMRKSDASAFARKVCCSAFEIFSSDRAHPPSMLDPISFLDGTLKEN
jgi:hypothetical protein